MLNRRQPTARLLIRSLLLFVFCVVCVRTVQAQTDAATAADTLAETVSAPALPAPATNVRAYDIPNDHGHGIGVEWDLSANDGQGQNSVLQYQILRTPRMEGPIPVEDVPAGDPAYRVFESTVYNEAGWHFIAGAWDTVGVVPSRETEYQNKGAKVRDDRDFLPDFVDFQYRVVASTAEARGARWVSPE